MMQRNKIDYFLRSGSALPQPEMPTRRLPSEEYEMRRARELMDRSRVVRKRSQDTIMKSGVFEIERWGGCHGIRRVQKAPFQWKPQREIASGDGIRWSYARASARVAFLSWKALLIAKASLLRQSLSPHFYLFLSETISLSSLSLSPRQIRSQSDIAQQRQSQAAAAGANVGHERVSRSR